MNAPVAPAFLTRQMPVLLLLLDQKKYCENVFIW